MWKIIWRLFHSIAEGLQLIMKKNIIHMASTVTFVGPCSFDRIFHYIFAHLGLYFADNGTNLPFEFLNWLRSIVHIHIFQFWQWKFINHGSIVQSVHRNSRSSFIFKEIRSNDSFCPKTAPNSDTLRIERLFNIHFRVFRAPKATILLINVAYEVKMSLIAHNDFYVPPARKLTFPLQLRVTECCVFRYRGI